MKQDFFVNEKRLTVDDGEPISLAEYIDVNKESITALDVLQMLDDLHKGREHRIPQCAGSYAVVKLVEG